MVAYSGDTVVAYLVLLWIIPWFQIMAFSGFFISDRIKKRIVDSMETGEFSSYGPWGAKWLAEFGFVIGIFGVITTSTFYILILLTDLSTCTSVWISFSIFFISGCLQLAAWQSLITFKRRLAGGLEDGSIKLTGWWKVHLWCIPPGYLKFVAVVAICMHFALLIKFLFLII